MRRVSKKQAERLREYNKVRKEYLSNHEVCEVETCNNESTDIHHKKGRLGLLLCDTNYFMAVCRTCHCYIEENPFEAKAKGYSLNRLSC